MKGHPTLTPHPRMLGLQLYFPVIKLFHHLATSHNHPEGLFHNEIPAGAEEEDNQPDSSLYLTYF